MSLSWSLAVVLGRSWIYCGNFYNKSHIDLCRKKLPGAIFLTWFCFSIYDRFPNGALSQLEYDVVTIDGSVDRSTARASVGDRVALQGNYDPRELIENEEGTKTPETVRATAKEMLEALGPQKLIANLGEGLGGKESTTLVDVFVNSIHEESAAMISASKWDE